MCLYIKNDLLEHTIIFRIPLKHLRTALHCTFLILEHSLLLLSLDLSLFIIRRILPSNSLFLLGARDIKLLLRARYAIKQ